MICTGEDKGLDQSLIKDIYKEVIDQALFIKFSLYGRNNADLNLMTKLNNLSTEKGCNYYSFEPFEQFEKIKKEFESEFIIKVLFDDFLYSPGLLIIIPTLQ